MTHWKKPVLVISTLAACVLGGFAKNTKMSGKMVAYDVMKHTSKDASGQVNQEVVILETTSAKPKLVKVVFSSTATTQIESKYFDGSQPLDVQVFRDRGCDENAPRFVAEVPLQMGGNYLLTDTYKNHPPGKIKSLECYAAIASKKN